MTELGTHWERESLGGGRYRHTQFMRPIAYHDGVILRRIVSDFADSGDGAYPHIVSAAQLKFSVGANGERRMHPTGEMDRYVAFGRPMIKPAASWQNVPWGAAVRSANKITWSNANAVMTVTHIGHAAKLDIELLNGYVPPNSQFAWPISLTGLTRQGGTLLADGVPVASVRAPVVIDAANPADVRPIDWQIGAVGGQTGVLFTLPSLTGMTRPVIDPTVALQPDATDGKDATFEADYPDLNIGASNTIYIGKQQFGQGPYRSTVQFVLTDVPATATVTAATLSLYCLSNDSGNARIYHAYRLKRPWVEAQVTWNIYSTGNSWQTAGGFGSNDCEQTDIGNRTFTATEVLNEFKDFALTPAAVQGWTSGAFANNGLLLKADTENADRYGFASSDHATAASRPKISVDYTVASSKKRHPIRLLV